MSKKPKVRVFTKKKRGHKKFLADNMNLIRNEAQQNGLLEFDKARMGYVFPKVPTPEMVQLAVDAKARAKAISRGTTPKSTSYTKRATDWTRLWSALDLYDRANQSTVTAALRLWLELNPSVRELNNTKRNAALRDAATNMIKHLDAKAGRDTLGQLLSALTVEKKGSSVVAVFVKEV